MEVNQAKLMAKGMINLRRLDKTLPKTVANRFLLLRGSIPLFTRFQGRKVIPTTLLVKFPGVWTAAVRNSHSAGLDKCLF